MYLLHGHASTEDGGDGEVATVTWVARCHHVLGVEHLLRQLGHGQGTVLLAATRRQRSKAGHEEVKSREWNHVDGQLAQVGVQLAGETQACRDAGHGGRHKVVEVAVRRSAQFQRAETNVIQRLVVDAVCLVGVFHQLVDGQCRVVRLDNCV